MYPSEKQLGLSYIVQELGKASVIGAHAAPYKTAQIDFDPCLVCFFLHKHQTCMGSELVQWLKVGGQGGTTHHAPHIAGASIVGCYHQAAIQGNSDAAHSCANFGDELTAASVGCEIPHTDVAMLVPYSHRIVTYSMCCSLLWQERQEPVQDLLV